MTLDPLLTMTKLRDVCTLKYKKFPDAKNKSWNVKYDRGYDIFLWLKLKRATCFPSDHSLKRTLFVAVAFSVDQILPTESQTLFFNLSFLIKCLNSPIGGSIAPIIGT